jgi:hypothetical protein
MRSRLRMSGSFAPEAALGGIETPTSALLPKADATRKSWQVRNVPIAEVTVLFDHLVGVGKQHGGNRNAQRFSSLEVDDEIELLRTLYG